MNKRIKKKHRMLTRNKPFVFKIYEPQTYVDLSYKPPRDLPPICIMTHDDYDDSKLSQYKHD